MSMLESLSLSHKINGLPERSRGVFGAEIQGTIAARSMAISSINTFTSQTVAPTLLNSTHPGASSYTSWIEHSERKRTFWPHKIHRYFAIIPQLLQEFMLSWHRHKKPEKNVKNSNRWQLWWQMRQIVNNYARQVQKILTSQSQSGAGERWYREWWP